LIGDVLNIDYCSGLKHCGSDNQRSTINN